MIDSPFPDASPRDRALARAWQAYEDVRHALRAEGLHDHALALDATMDRWTKGARARELRSLARGAAGLRRRAPRDYLIDDHYTQAQRRQAVIRTAWAALVAWASVEIPSADKVLDEAWAAYRKARHRVRARESGITRRTGIGRDERHKRVD